MRYFLFLCCLFLTSISFALDSGEWTTQDHSILINDTKLDYQSTYGLIPIENDEEKIHANIFFIAYTKKEQCTSNRPITFVFNGGPGSSAVWLHMGAFGPKRFLTFEENQDGSPPYEWLANEETLLDITDLVFIDPVGTGFSRPEPESTGEEFYEVEGDIRSIGNFIEKYLTEFHRWASPKYLAGESYGTTRGAGISEYLHKEGIYLNGLIFISVAIDFQTICFNSGNLLPYALFLPSYAATAFYHKKVDTDLSFEDFLKEVREFTYKEYLPSLYMGNILTLTQKKQLIEKLSYYTGIKSEFFKNNDSRITDREFFREFLKEENYITGRMDSRFTAPDLHLSFRGISRDPSAAPVCGIFTSGFHAYLQEELGIHDSSSYKVFNSDVNHKWNFIDYDFLSLNLSNAVTTSLYVNPKIKIFVANGYYDLATPFLASEYTFQQLQIPEDANFTMEYYHGGHMFYLDREAHKKFKNELVDFYTK